MQQGFTLWFTGLSGAGKSTLANALAPVLLERGLRIEILDGDLIRQNLSKGLGFSREDRETNLRRIGFVAHLLSRNGVVVLVAAIAPYTASRAANRELIGRYYEVFVDCPLEVLIQRDPKGLYRRALAGEIRGFTGIDDPYEAPEHPDLQVHTDRESQEESLAAILRFLEDRQLVPG